MADPVQEVVVTGTKTHQPYELRAPRHRLVVSGVEIDAVIRTSVDSNDNYAADSFTASVALNGDNDPNWWIANSKQTVSIYHAFEDDDGSIDWGDPIFQGIQDEAELDWDEACINLRGRDLTALFLDTFTSKAYTNKTASQIVQLLAANHGITADVTATTKKVGQLYDTDHEVITLDSFSQERSEWKMMTHLAQLEGYELWVDSPANTVRFHPAVPLETAAVSHTVHAPPQDGADNLWRYLDSSTYNIVENLKVKHNTALAKGTGVIIKSFSSDKFKAVIGKAGKTGANDTPYQWTYPGLSQSAATAMANQRLQDILKRTFTVTWMEPGTLTYGVRDVVLLQGTNTVADQKYHIESITRTMDTEGYSQQVNAINRQPASAGGDGSD